MNNRLRAGIAVSTALATFLLPFLAKADDASPLADARALYEKNCAVCHPLERSLEKKVDREGWKATITKMIANGAKLDEQQAGQIVDYLTAKSLFETKCNVCHDLAKPLAAIKNLEEWRTTVATMAAKKPDLVTEAEAGAIVLYLSLAPPAK